LKAGHALILALYCLLGTRGFISNSSSLAVRFGNTCSSSLGICMKKLRGTEVE